MKSFLIDHESDPDKSDFRLFILAVLLIGGSALLLVAGCNRTDATTKPEPVSPAPAVPAVKTAEAEADVNLPKGSWAEARRQSVREFVPAIGSFLPRKNTQLGSQVSGRVEKVFVEVGDHIKTGQELVRLDPTFFEIEFTQRKAELQGAKVAMADAELNFNRMKNLWEKPSSSGPPSISRKLYDDARLKLEATTAQFNQAQEGVRYTEQRLRETIIRAPYDAVVSKRMVDPGQPVTATPATFLLEIQEVKTLNLDFSLPQNMLAQIKVGTPFEFEVEGIENGKGTGKIAIVFPAVDEATRSFHCRAYIDNPNMKYHPGLLAQIRVLSREIQEAVVVPRRAVVQTATNWVTIVSTDGHSSTRTLRVGVVTDQVVEVLEGLKPGDKVFIPAGK